MLKLIERLLASVRAERPHLTSRGRAFTIARAAEEIGIPETSLLRMKRQGLLRTVMVDGQELVLRSEIIRQQKGRGSRGRDARSRKSDPGQG